MPPFQLDPLFLACPVADQYVLLALIFKPPSYFMPDLPQHADQSTKMCQLISMIVAGHFPFHHSLASLKIASLIVGLLCSSDVIPQCGALTGNIYHPTTIYSTTS